MESLHREEVSPLFNREQEKDELKYLNDRLTTYIEAVKKQKGKNLTLEVELAALKNEVSLAAERVKKLYETELAATRTLLAETEEERGRQKDLADQLTQEHDDLRSQLDQLRHSLEDVEKRFSLATQRYNQYEGQYNTTEHEVGQMRSALKDAQKELNGLKSQLQKLTQDLDDETSERSNLLDKIKALRKEISELEKKFVGNLDKMKTGEVRWHFHTDGPDPVSDEGRLEEVIDELREQTEKELGQYKMELDDVYSDKYTTIESQITRNAETIASLSIDLKKETDSNSRISKDIQRLHSQIERLERSLKERDDNIRKMKQEHSEDVTRVLEELRSLRISYEEKLKEYKELFEVKLQLDQELATYRMLLEEEEARLLITPSPTKRGHPDSAGSPSGKRPRFRLEKESVNSANISTTATGDLQIVDVDPAGKCIRIRNMSDQPEHLGNFKLVHKSKDNPEEDMFVFHGRSRLKGGITTAIWCKAAGEEHNPPTDIVCKQVEVWSTGQETTTTLYNNKGEVVATYIQRKEKSSSVHYSSLEGVQEVQAQLEA